MNNDRDREKLSKWIDKFHKGINPVTDLPIIPDNRTITSFIPTFED